MQQVDEIRWGILGCGDVCEVKSGPAFSKVPNSRLVAVMRRDGDKARDFARRHGVPRYYNDAADLLRDEEVNAIYIATPPAFHEQYTLQAIRSGKHVYVEKPVSTTSASCERMIACAREGGSKVSVAHYRRALPLFVKIKDLLESGVIGQPRLIQLNTLLRPADNSLQSDYWRTNPEISGGGLFFDLAPHQLDLFYWLFGHPAEVRGFSMNQRSNYEAPDLTNLEAVFNQRTYLHGLWAFNVNPLFEKEDCDIIGDLGKVSFSFFNMRVIEVSTADGVEKISVDQPRHVQQPMIDAVVRYFRDEGPNPCSLDEALITMRMMDATTSLVSA